MEDAIDTFAGILFGLLYPRVPEATWVLLSCQVRTCHIHPVARVVYSCSALGLL